MAPVIPSRRLPTDAALYRRVGHDTFVATDCTKSSWYDARQAGGAVLALLGHVLEDVPTLTAMSLTRLTVDIVRPVPIGPELRVATEILREGKKIQVVDLVVWADDVPTTRARALRIRDLDVRDRPGMPTSTTAVNPSSSLPGPDDLPTVEHREGVADFLRDGAEIRRSPEPIEGVSVVWTRLRVPVVEGEPVRRTSLAAFPLDMVNLLGVDLDRTTALPVNPDVCGHLCRAPVGPWVALTGQTYDDHGVGHGVSVATMSDRDGAFGTTSTSQLLDPV